MKRPKKAARKAAKKGKKTAKTRRKSPAKKTTRKGAKKTGKKTVKKTTRKTAARPKAKAKKKTVARKKPAAKKKSAASKKPAAQKKPVKKPATRKTAAKRPPLPKSAPPAAMAAPAAAAATASDKVRRLELDSWAQEAAMLMANEFPNIAFTSGRRSTASQARAMAQNIRSAPAGRSWIRETYADNPESREMQQWVDDHPQATGEAEIAAGLQGVMDAWAPERLGTLSRHLTGLAFDIQPIGGDGATQIKARMGTLPHLHGKPLFREGGAERWHVAFKSRAEEPA